ncbi:Catechol 2,3-dioxygenase-like protein [Cupriavidus necator]|uniref:Catechol 2,3-dioxygenase-like protein n=2 Tax=Burkholderiaceae TaxID=119060 RepID=A0A1K0JSR1_CUPNE|nr:Catechol 2,3-dioxygenase-like protein [Cupriavidus necator]
MSIIKATGVAYGRLRAPDLDRMEAFLLDFGMVRVARNENTLYMRGTGPAQYIHVTEKGSPAFLGMAYRAGSEADLEKLTRVPGASAVEPIDAPGGGKRVRLRDPDGYLIEVVHGIAPLPELPITHRHPEQGRTVGVLDRIHMGPARVRSFGHAVIFTPRLQETLEWYWHVLGLLPSEEVYEGSPDNVLGSFNRCDCGDEFVDHHVAMFFSNATAGLNHLAFEVVDLDDVFTGHEHLQARGGYEPLYGVGRHLLGNQVFDYWGGPWGMVHEHYAHGDLLNASSGRKRVDIVQGFVSPWGGEPSEALLNRVVP